MGKLGAYRKAETYVRVSDLTIDEMIKIAKAIAE